MFHTSEALLCVDDFVVVNFKALSLLFSAKISLQGSLL